MNRIVISLYFLCIGLTLQSQTGFPRYYEYAVYVTRADSLYKAGKFTASASCYIDAIAVRVEKGIAVPFVDLHYSAACSWALAGQGDSAFVHLNAAAVLGYSDPHYLEKDQDLISLHGDSRWPGLLKQITSIAERKQRIKKIYEERTRFTGGSHETVFFPLHENIRQLIQTDSLPFISLNYENFRLYFRGDGYTATHLRDLEQQLSGAFNKVLAALDIGSYSTGINVILVDSRAELQEVTGIAAYGGMAFVGDNAVFLVFNGKRRLQAKHEIFHLISQDAWGITTSRLLDEGGAVYADNECYFENPIYSISAWLKSDGRLLSFKSLITDFDNEARKSDVIAYLESATIFKYLYTQYGMEKLKRLRSEGFEKFEEIYGFPVTRLEKEWNQMISRIKIPEGVDWKKLLEEGCG